MSQQFQFGLIGRNISYSLSVEIFEAIFNHCKATGRFELFSLEPDHLHSQLRQLSLNGYKAFSVTIPYKQSVISELDEIDNVASRLQAVNSIVVSSGRLLGYNTDCYGFSLPLKQHASALRSGHAIILGCGGAAKAVMYALSFDMTMKQVTIFGRSAKKLAQFKSESESFVGGMGVETLEWSKLNPMTLGKPDIIINCTPLGGHNFPDDNPFVGNCFPDCHIYYDLNYNENNKLIEMASQSGRITIDGSAMLVGQAVRSFDIWTGLSVPVEEIYRRVFERQLVI